MSLNQKRELFEKLSKLDVLPYTEDKNGLTYLGWGAAYAVLSAVCDDVRYGLETTEADPDNTVFRSGTGAEVRVHLGVLYKGEHIVIHETLPILQNGTKHKEYKDVTGADVNKAAKRAFVKAAAHLGLGLNLYIKAANGVVPQVDRIARSMVPLDERLEELRAQLAECKGPVHVKSLMKGMLADERAAMNGECIAKGKSFAKPEVSA